MIDILSQYGIPVIPVNMEGVMGAGLAKQAKERLPGMLDRYRKELRTGNLRLGHPVYVLPEGNWPTRNRGVILFATKDRYSQPSRYDWIDRGMREIAIMANTSIGFSNNHIWVPALGCGLGGLDERRVYEMYMFILGHLPLVHFVGSDGVERSVGDTLFRTRGKGE